MRSVIVTVLALTLAGCGGDRDGRVDFSGDEIGPDLYAVTSEDGNVKLGFTAEFLYFALSDSVRAEVEAELERDAEQEGFFRRMMLGLVGRALGFRTRFPVAEVEDVRWQDGELLLVFTDPERTMDRNFQLSEDEPVQQAFSEETVEAFGAAFRRFKAGEEAPYDSTPGSSGR